MQRQTTLALWCERIIEGGWLLALVLIPSYFNLLSSRHFEPDKATTLRSIFLVMAAAAIIRWLERLGSEGRRTPAAAAATPRPGLWRRLVATPLAVPILVYVLVFLVATIFSVVPATSFWGSYQRLQGTYTNLSYVGLAAIIMFTLRRREQLERLITVTVLGSLGAVGYGLVQHFQIDPLPWKGDVVSRVASTMGNSIFVAAYLIMIVPYGLYRAIVAFHDARHAEPSDRPGADVAWAAGYLLLVLGSLALIFGAIQFGAVVRISSLGTWWVYPGALVVATALYILPTLRPHAADRLGLASVIPGVLAIVYVLAVGIYFLASGATTRAQPGRIGEGWPLWMVGGALLVVAAYALFFTAPRRPATTRLMFQLQAVGMLVIVGLLLLTIFFTQSRGPWIGAGAGLFVFFTLLLIRARRRALAEGSPRAALWRNLLIAEVALTVLLGGFVVAFNTSDAPAFAQLRQVPYIGRMGTLLETDSGTGLVRRLIWLGDDKAGGAVALITAEPLRTIVGWGPESMFVVYNKFYPPELANIESRGASPDRSHQAYLDELVNKGLLGLASYLFVLFSFFALAWRLMRRIDDWRVEVLCIAAIAIVTAHCVEGLTGIPIVATLMLFWVTIAVVFVTGAIAGEYATGTAPEPAAEPAAEPAPSPKAQPSARGGRRRQGAVARGAQSRAPAARSAGRKTSPVAWLTASLVMLIALLGAWFVNADNVYADMRFQQGQLYTDTPRAALSEQLIGASYYIDSIRLEPGQDFYYLSLGRALMSIVDIRRQDPQMPLGSPKPDADLDDLRGSNLREAEEFVARTAVDQVRPGSLPGGGSAPEVILNQTLLETMSYAEAVLERARELNPLNKDHYANLGRLHSFWYSRLTGDPEQLRQAIGWYEQATEIAPQDVTILNEHASTVALIGNYLQTQGDQAAANAAYEEAGALLEKSAELDPQYLDTTLRTADLLRLRGSYAEAADRYIELVEENPHALDGQVGNVIEGLRPAPDQLLRLRDAYAEALEQRPDDAALHSFVGLMSIRAGDGERAVEAFGRQVELEPTNLEARRNYTLVLSDTGRYEQAAAQMADLLALLRQQDPNQAFNDLEALLAYFRQRAAGG